MPHRKSVAAPWRLKRSRYALVGTSCSCGKLHMPGRNVCECGNTDLVHFVFGGNGEIISYTRNHVAPAGFEKDTPYNIALIRLEEGPIVSGVVVNRDGVAVGKKVRSVFRRISTDGEDGLITYGFKFELVD